MIVNPKTNRLTVSVPIPHVSCIKKLRHACHVLAVSLRLSAVLQCHDIVLVLSLQPYGVHVVDCKLTG